MIGRSFGLGVFCVGNFFGGNVGGGVGGVGGLIGFL